MQCFLMSYTILEIKLVTSKQYTEVCLELGNVTASTLKHAPLQLVV